MKTHSFAATPQALVLTLVAAALLAACSKPGSDTSTASTAAPPSQAAPPATQAAPATAAPAIAHDDAGIAWKHASNDAEVDAAFALAKSESKPVFVYWGAKWCPPCNQVKATLFNRQDFIERSRAFVPVYVDGDSPGAQKIGARFKVSGYPTMVLFTPQGQEVTRLPGEVDPVRYTEVLTLGMNAARPVSAVLADPLVTAFDTALKRLEADPALSRADRMQALIARVDLARIDVPEADADAAPAKPAAPVVLPPELLADVREQTARADREISDGYERQ